MADYSQSKPALGALSPQNAVESSFGRNEPLVTPKAVRERELFGIPLRDPVTKKEMTDEMIHEFILDAVTLAEQETGLNIFPTQIDERQEFDRNEYMTMGYMRLKQRPVSSIESLSITASNDLKIWRVSNDWIDNGYLAKGQIYIIPINIATAVQGSQGAGAGGAAFLAILGQQGYVPAYWRVKYTTGFPDGLLPRNVNYLIATIAAIEILVKMAQANAKSGSRSIGIDGLSQSTSNPGPDVYNTAIENLKERRKMLVSRLRTRFGTKLFSGNV